MVLYCSWILCCSLVILWVNSCFLTTDADGDDRSLIADWSWPSDIIKLMSMLCYRAILDLFLALPIERSSPLGVSSCTTALFSDPRSVSFSCTRGLCWGMPPRKPCWSWLLFGSDSIITALVFEKFIWLLSGVWLTVAFCISVKLLGPAWESFLGAFRDWSMVTDISLTSWKSRSVLISESVLASLRAWIWSNSKSAYYC